MEVRIFRNTALLLVSVKRTGVPCASSVGWRGGQEKRLSSDPPPPVPRGVLAWCVHCELRDLGRRVKALPKQSSGRREGASHPLRCPLIRSIVGIVGTTLLVEQ